MNDAIAFNVEMATNHGVDIAIIHNFFIEYKKSFEKYPSFEQICKKFPFSSSVHIDNLISELYKSKLI